MNDDQNQLSVTQAPERWSIKTAQFYERMKRLEIKPIKEGKKAYLTADQIQLMDALDEHLKQGGKMEDFGALSVSKSAEVESTQEVEEVHSTAVHDDFAALIKSAQEHAAGSLIAKYTLSAQFQNQPELLADDLRSHVEAAKRAAAPKSQSPDEIASGIIAQFRKRHGVA